FSFWESGTDLLSRGIPRAIIGAAPFHGPVRDAPSRNRNLPNASLCPLQPFADGATHHPVLVALGQEGQLLGAMGDALAPGHAGEGGVGRIGGAIAVLRSV